MSTQRARHSRTRNAAQVASSSGGLVMASRPVGNFTAEKNDITVKSCITESMDHDLRQYARAHGYSSTSDLIREVLKIALYGPDHVLDLHRARIEALAKNLAGSRT